MNYVVLVNVNKITQQGEAMKKRTIIYTVIAILAISAITTSVYYFQMNNKNTTNKAQSNKAETPIRSDVIYRGKAGVSALTLLEQNAKIVTSGTGENAFVTTINDVIANPKNQYWSFNVNGKTAPVGAGSYITQDSDTITWKLATF